MQEFGGIAEAVEMEQMKGAAQQLLQKSAAGAQVGQELATDPETFSG